MKICIYGAGAVGGIFAAKLHQAGYEVSIIARGKRLFFLKENGLVINTPEGKITEKIRTTDNPDELGEQDYIIAAPKAYDLPGIAANLGSMLGAKTKFATAMNGLPWWYFKSFSPEGFSNPSVGGRFAQPKAGSDVLYSHNKDLLNYNFKSLDPNGVIEKNIPITQIISMVVYLSSSLNKNQEIDYVGGRRFILGQPDNKISDSLEELHHALAKAGFKPVITQNIREEIWLKLWGNISYNPISVLTGKGMADIVTEPETKDMAEKIMREMQSVAEAVGVNLPVTVEQRMEEARKSGGHKTSMLQDAEKGSRLEIDGIMGPVLEISELLKFEVPAIRKTYKELAAKYAH